MPHTKAKPVVNTRIQARNKELILEAALDVFSASGFRGATVDQIAAKSEMSKPNLLYYFRRKEDIYVALLEHTLSDWLEPLRELNPAGDPLTELARYISAKLQMSEANPKASRLFANEVLHGAPMIEKFLKGPLRQLVAEKSLGHPVLDRGGKDCPRRSLSSDLRHLGRDPALRRFFRAGRCGAGPPRGFKGRAESRAGNSPARFEG